MVLWTNILGLMMSKRATGQMPRNKNNNKPSLPPPRRKNGKSMASRSTSIPVGYVALVAVGIYVYIMASLHRRFVPKSPGRVIINDEGVALVNPVLQAEFLQSKNLTLAPDTLLDHLSDAVQDSAVSIKDRYVAMTHPFRQGGVLHMGSREERAGEVGDPKKRRGVNPQKLLTNDKYFESLDRAQELQLRGVNPILTGQLPDPKDLHYSAQAGKQKSFKQNDKQFQANLQQMANTLAQSSKKAGTLRTKGVGKPAGLTSKASRTVPMPGGGMYQRW